MASQNIQRARGGNKTVEKLAVDPYIQRDTIVNELIRNYINPDTSSGVDYYLGKITKIITELSTGVQIRDIFWSPFDNHERISKSISTKGKENSSIFLMVHVPSFITGNGQSTENLNYDTFTKIRVEYSGNKNPKVGNIVKIGFRDKKNFYDPYVIDIENTQEEALLKKQNDYKKLFNEYTDCKSLSLLTPTEQTSVDFSKVNSPFGGYVQAIQAINTLFSPKYISQFLMSGISTQDYIKFGSPDPGKVGIKGLLLLDNRVYSQFSSEEVGPQLKIESNGKQEKPYEMKLEITVSGIAGGDTSKFKKLFFKNIESELDNKLGYGAPFTEKDMTIDINSNRLYGKTQKLLEDYIKASKDMKERNTYYASGTILNENGDSIITPAVSENACERKFSARQGIYPEAPTIIWEAIGEKYALEFSKVSKLKPNFFYLSSPGALTNLSFTQGNPALNIGIEFSPDKHNVHKNLRQTNEFLIKLKKMIGGREGLALNNVGIEILQLLKNYTHIALGRSFNPRSRHFFGKAVDIRVYIREGEKIYEIPTEIVFLYAKQVLKDNKHVGYGVLLSKGYLHVEFLDGSGILDEELVTRVYTANKSDVEKKIQKSEANIIPMLKEYILQKNIIYFGKRAENIREMVRNVT